MREPTDPPTDDFEIADPVPDTDTDTERPAEAWEDENTDDPVEDES